jgi:hypothetical protein
LEGEDEVGEEVFLVFWGCEDDFGFGDGEVGDEDEEGAVEWWVYGVDFEVWLFVNPCGVVLFSYCEGDLF